MNEDSFNGARRGFNDVQLLTVYCSPKDKKAWLAKAKAKGLSVNDWAAMVLNQSVGNHETH